MKVLLINPTGGPSEEYGALAKAATELPQLGVASIAASLHNHGYPTRVIDFFMEKVSTEELLEIIRSDGYDIVGFSVYITTEQKTFELAQKIKSNFPEVKICVGGPQATLAPENFKKDFLDYVFLGEADLTLVELIQNLEKGLPYPENISGLLYNNGTPLQGNRETNLVSDLNDLPLFDLEQYYDLSNYYPPIHIRGNKVINLVSVRGCPYPCTFCAVAAINGTKFRKVSIERFVDNIELYTRKGYDSFMIYDDTFTLDKKRAVAISKEILKRKLKIFWNCWSRVDCVDDNTLSYMKEAGCYLITYGCESMNPKTLDKLKKGYGVEQNIEGIEITKRNGLLASSSFMIGLPGETREDILNTISKVNSTELDLAFFPVFEPYKGTPIYDDCVTEGRWMVDERYSNRLLVDQKEVWVPNTLARKEIEKLSRKAFKSFYLRPYTLFNLPKVLSKLPFARKIRFISSALDYFLWSNLRRTPPNQIGSKFKS
jgi:radical SAM superfamily enzyme YgiQ (UPF0313 family)